MKSVGGLIVAILLAVGAAGASYAQDMLQVQSETDGAGRFTYTFSNTNETWAWAISDAFGTVLFIPSYCVEAVTCPDGWTASVSSNDYVICHYTNGAYIIQQDRLTFVIQSRATNATLYTDSSGFFQRGGLLGMVYTNGVPYEDGGSGFTVSLKLVPNPVLDSRMLRLRQHNLSWAFRKWQVQPVLSREPAI